MGRTGNRLVGKTAIITGASAGIGRATAYAMADQGANLVLTARRAERLIELTEDLRDLGAKAVFVPGDASVEATAVAVVKQAMDTFGKIDILINNAGVGFYKPLVETTVEEYDTMVNTNVRSGFLFSRHVAPHLIAQKSGTLLFVSSVAGLFGYPTEAVYCATKFAQIGMAQALDKELSEYGIHVGAICPGGVKTEFAIGHGRTVESVKASDMMEPEEVAEAIVLACAQKSGTRIHQLVMRPMSEPWG